MIKTPLVTIPLRMYLGTIDRRLIESGVITLFNERSGVGLDWFSGVNEP